MLPSLPAWVHHHHSVGNQTTADTNCTSNKELENRADAYVQEQMGKCVLDCMREYKVQIPQLQNEIVDGLQRVSG
jgi:hypothetical protein